MRRALAAILVLAVVVAGVVVLASRGGSSPPTYKVVLDNAFGLTTGADVRAAGVKVGSVSALDVQPRTARAVVTAKISRPEFGGLRADAFCTVKPQSLIGEYFLDCDPGTSPHRLGDGGTVPIARTAGTVPPDLVQDVLRRPYRERLGILISELGAGFAARGGDVNATISRAIPALRETDKVLGLLSEERQTLAQLTRDSAGTLGKLDANRADVARFVAEARDTAVASANRRADLAGTIRRLPAFQRELRPTLAALGTAARRQTPALANLRAAAPSLTTLLQRLGPFADAARPAVRALGRASVIGVDAVKPAAATVRRLRALAAAAKQPLTNLRFVLEHLDDRANAVEPNPESPGGKGFTGLEALLQYFFNQSQAINLFDDRGYALKIALLLNECSAYTDAAGAERDPGRAKRCSGALGPGGKLEPVAAKPASTRAKRRRATTGPATPSTPPPAPSAAPAVPAPSVTPPAPAPAPEAPPRELKIPGLPPIRLPPTNGASSRNSGGVLDFLLGP